MIESGQTQPLSPDRWKMRSARFIWSSRVFFLSLGGGLVYACSLALSFAPALRDLQIATDTIRQREGVEKYAAAIREAIEKWPSFVANYPVGWPELSGFIVVVLCVAVFLVWLRRRPRAEMIDLQQLPAPIRERFKGALERFGKPLRMFAVKTFGRGTYRFGNDIYLSQDMLGLLYLKNNVDAADQLYFVLQHETVHHDAFDNAFVAIGRSILFVVAITTVLFVANFVMGASVMAFPTTLRVAIGDSAANFIVVLVGLTFLILMAVTMSGFSAAFYGVREFFADVIPAAVSGPTGHPYRGPGDKSKRGTWLSAWDLPPSPVDRLEHVLGTTPRSGALIAFATAYWIALRTLILTIDSRGSTGFVWLFDLATLGAIVAMLLDLPRRVKGRIDYGMVPWLATATIVVGLVFAAWQFAVFLRDYLKFDVVSPAWLLAVSVPPIVVVAILAVYTLVPGSRSIVPAVSPFEHPRAVSLSRLWLSFIALPARIVSVAIAIYPLYLIGAGVTRLLQTVAGMRRWNAIYALDVAAIVIAIPIIALVLKNLYAASRWLGWVEAGISILLLGFIAAALETFMLAQSEAAQASVPGAVNYALILDVASRNSAMLTMVFALCMAVAGIILVPSWWARLYVDIKRQSRGR